MYLNNVRVNGITVSEKQDPWFILGVLNSRAVDFVFRRIAKVKDGGYFEANKQFIAPLPIPLVSKRDRDAVATRAKELQSVHTSRRDILSEIARRLSAMRFGNRPETWLFPGLRTKREVEADAPARLDAEKKRAWANQRYDLDLASRQEIITARLVPGASLFASFNDGELCFSVDGIPVIERIFVNAAEGEFIVAQWKVLCSTFSVTEKTDGKKLANALRKLAVPDNPALVAQIIERERKLSAFEADIAVKEREMDALVYRLYGLADVDVRMIEAD